MVRRQQCVPPVRLAAVSALELRHVLALALRLWAQGEVEEPYLNPFPLEVRHVVVRDRGEDHDVPVENGYFLYAAWKTDTPGDDTTDPPTPEVIPASP